MTEIIFWLVLIGAGSPSSQVILPVPFQAVESCNMAGDKFAEKIWYGGKYTCLPQPRTDVELWTEAHADRDGGY